MTVMQSWSLNTFTTFGFFNLATKCVPVSVEYCETAMCKVHRKEKLRKEKGWQGVSSDGL